jgi:2-dehydropantoate 2-reductase
MQAKKFEFMANGAHVSEVGALKIVVLGAGGLGSFLGAALAKSGEDVSFIARGNHLVAMRDRALTVESVSLGKFQLRVKATDKLSEIGAVDLVLFSVKSYDTETALQMMTPLIGKDTVVLSFQNGVENEDKIAEVIGKSHVLAGAISIESFIGEPGLIKQTMGPAMMAIGEMNGEITPRAKKIHRAFINASLKCELSSRIQEILWEKFLFICATGGVCSITRASLGEVLEFEPTRQLYTAAMKEVQAVASAKRINLPKDLVSRTLAQADRMNKSTKPSMLRDLERGKRLEIDALNGSVSRFGRQLSVPTPVNDFIYSSLKLQDLKVAGNVQVSTIS